MATDNLQSEQVPVVVIMVPFPAQSHLNQALDLSHRLLLSSTIPVHYISYNINIRQVKLRANRFSSSQLSKIHFHGFPAPHFDNPPPNPNSPTKFPTHLQPFFEAYSQLREPVGQLMSQLSPTARRVVVIHDLLMSSVIQDCVSLPNTESYVFNTNSAFTIFFYSYEGSENPFPVEADLIPNSIPSLDGCFTSDIIDIFVYQFGFTDLDVGELYNTCRVVEGEYLDLLTKFEHKRDRKQWAIGPLNPMISKQRSSTNTHYSLEWLDKQEPNSVLYISFGSTTSMSDEQIKELAIGLEESKIKFIWVLRHADKGDIFARENERTEIELPQGYEERVKGMGMIMRDWGPQIEILGHPSTGGFMSHCGWGSCMESISMGVPIVAWPMHSDQPRNAVLLSQVLGVGFVVQEWEDREKIVLSSCISGAVRRLMASEQGVEMRRKANELGIAVQQAVDECGVSRVELESFIAHVTR